MATGNIGHVSAPTFAELLSGPLVDIYVGESQRHWALHRNLLCHHSELLESELHHDGKKKQERLDLHDFDPSGFELLVKWMYQGRLDDVSDVADSTQKYDYAVSCHKLYLLCDRFDMPQLKNVAMDQYRKGLHEAGLVPDADEINDIYRKSPTGSPFRRLMTRIAARQIMDPDNDRDVETYRECFEDNPQFAIDLINAIKQSSGGVLFEDPTDMGNECDYHDHEAGPNCHIKGKGKIIQVFKTRARPNDPKSSKSEPSANTDPHHRPPRPTQNQALPRQAHPQNGVSVGPLRRRLTSPASSTVETSTETVTATPLSPNEQRDKFRKVSPPLVRLPDRALAEESPQVQDGPLPSSDDGSLSQLDSSRSDVSDKAASPKIIEETSPRRGIWDWAKAGTGRLGLIGRIPHPGIMTSKAATTAVNGVLEEGKTTKDVGSLDDFSVPSAVSTQPDNEERLQEAAAAKIEGLGISNSSIEEPIENPPHFAQTKRSSDDLVAASSTTGTPSPKAFRTSESVMDDNDDESESMPATPTPPARVKDTKMDAESTPSPHRIPKYKIALASHMLSPSTTPRSATS
ncbi:hypothetical protein EJ04DRAFT_513566 [Polyplosphaeria fusca]|uniref:BTB domain-containing protein n=1 Tax=Polyplosphaeria fusca TaxID=682080 RepID=A0A9P4QUX9_9PLEO|nr:hypothetical protein EJ04DRAFT_513566 [Polyplosphaeria fusca]